jgi:hypothetical protein
MSVSARSNAPTSRYGRITVSDSASNRSCCIERPVRPVRNRCVGVPRMPPFAIGACARRRSGRSTGPAGSAALPAGRRRVAGLLTLWPRAGAGSARVRAQRTSLNDRRDQAVVASCECSSANATGTRARRGQGAYLVAPPQPGVTVGAWSPSCDRPRADIMLGRR